MLETFTLTDVEITNLNALVFPQNVRSILVLERLGMSFVETLFDEETGRQACLYSVSKTDFIRCAEARRIGAYSSRSK